MDDQAMMDIDYFLGEDHRAAAEGEVVEGRRDGSFEGVLPTTTPNAARPRSTQSNTSSKEVHSSMTGSQRPSLSANERAASWV